MRIKVILLSMIMVLSLSACGKEPENPNSNPRADFDPVSFIMNENVAVFNENGKVVSYDYFRLMQFYSSDDKTAWEEVAYEDLLYNKVINRGDRFDLYADDTEMALEKDWKYVQVTSASFDPAVAYILAYDLDATEDVLIMMAWPEDTEYNGNRIDGYIDVTESSKDLVESMYSYGID